MHIGKTKCDNVCLIQDPQGGPSREFCGENEEPSSFTNAGNFLLLNSEL